MEPLLKTAEYSDLKLWDQSVMGITYGPVQSRRLGSSLGINLLGASQKICNFDCPYCELGLSNLKMSEVKKFDGFPSLEAIDTQLRQHLLILGKQNTKIDYITVSGNGEPTLYPQFAEAIGLLIKIRDELNTNAKVAVLSNGSTLDSSKIVRALNLADEKFIKLDCGNDDMLKKINGPFVRTGIQKLLHGIKKVSHVTLQTLFLQGNIDNTTPTEVDDWIEVVGIIKPKLVHLYNLDRVPPAEGLKQVPAQKLKEIAAKLHKRTGIKGIVFSS